MGSSTDLLVPGAARALAVLVAAGIDRALDEPPAALHPVVGTARLLTRLGAEP